MNLLSVAARVAEMTAQNPGDLPATAPPKVSQQEQQGQQQQEGQQEQVSYIKHEKGKGYCVKSEKSPGWSGGCYPSKGEAKKRLNQVEMFKHMKKGAMTPEDLVHDLRLVAARLAASTRPDQALVLSDLQSLLAAVDPEKLKELRERNKKNFPEPTGDPYHFNVVKDGTTIGVMDYLAGSPEEAQSKMGEFYKIPEGVTGVTIDGPHPGKGK